MSEQGGSKAGITVLLVAALGFGAYHFAGEPQTPAGVFRNVPVAPTSIARDASAPTSVPSTPPVAPTAVDTWVEP